MISNEIAAQLESAVLEYFAAAFAITVIATAVLFSGTAVSLLVRDKEMSNTIVQALGTERQAASLISEHERIAVVLSKYLYYRYIRCWNQAACARNGLDHR